MILYAVTVGVPVDLADGWSPWTQSAPIPDVMALRSVEEVVATFTA